jgi:hypothetical protein
MKTIEPNWIMDPGARLLEEKAIDLVVEKARIPFLARQLWKQFSHK